MRPKVDAEAGHHLAWLVETYGRDAHAVLEAYKQLAAVTDAMDDMALYAYVDATTFDASAASSPATMHWREGMRAMVLRIRQIAALDGGLLEHHLRRKQPAKEKHHG